MELIKEENQFVFICTFDQKDIPKRAGFWWDSQRKVWYTQSAKKAKYLEGYGRINFDEVLKEEEEKLSVEWNEKEKIFYWVGGYESKDIPKGAGFNWDQSNKQWFTESHVDAKKLEKYASTEVLIRISKGQESVKESKKTFSAIKLVRPKNQDYYDFQKQGIKFTLERKNTLISDEMGLGKSIQAIGVINNDSNIKSVLIICPASLKINWRNEVNKWLVRNMSVAISDTKNKEIEADIVITNYESLSKIALKEQYDLLIVDESQNIKNRKANRTKNVLNINADKKVFLTGTPIMNRPIELFTTLKVLAPNLFPNFMQYAKRYCNAFQNRFGWDMTGASNLDELQEKLRSSVMIRRLKKDVLKELPDKTRQMVELPSNGNSELINRQNELMREFLGDDEEDYSEKLRTMMVNSEAFAEIARIRHEVALAKVPYAIKHVEEMMESTGKVVLFAHHKDVIRQISDHFGNECVVLTGDTKNQDRQAIVEKFQNDDDCKLFIGSIRAAGVGLTLTASSNVVFVELDWTPAMMSQAEDRLHRIGQENAVNVTYLMFDGSIDVMIAKTIMRKQEVISEVLND